MDLSAENADADDREFSPRRGEARHFHYARVVMHGRVLARYAKPADRSAYANRLWEQHEKRCRMAKADAQQAKVEKVMGEFKRGELK